MNLRLLLLGILLTSHVCAQEWVPLSKAERDTAIAHHLKYESDNVNELLIYRGFVVNFNREKKAPNFTVHQVTPKQLSKTIAEKVKRADKFKPDTYNVPAGDQAVEDDYRNSGFDKGHFVPAADFYWDSQRKNETFFLTNIAPQPPDLNQVLWEKIESKIRDVVNDSAVNCYVITGALYKARRQRGMSDDKVGIPSAFYKVVYFQKNKKEYMNCFLVTHQFAYDNLDLHTYQVSLKEIENSAGYDFFDKLPDAKELALSSHIGELFLK